MSVTVSCTLTVENAERVHRNRKEGENMKVKTKILLWYVFWYITRTLLTSSVVIATLLTLWNLSYKLRGYYAFGGELILVVIFGIWAHITGKILHDWHKKAMYEVLKEETEQ